MMWQCPGSPAKRLSPWSGRAFPGHPLRDSDPEVFEIYGRVALTGEPERFEIYVKALKMWFSVSVYSPAREYFVAVFDVITERKRAESELKSFLSG